MEQTDSFAPEFMKIQHWNEVAPLTRCNGYVYARYREKSEKHVTGTFLTAAGVNYSFVYITAVLTSACSRFYPAQLLAVESHLFEFSLNFFSVQGKQLRTLKQF